MSPVETQSPAPRISFVSLGCPKALVDSERIITRLRAEGYELARKHDGADLVIVNTCGFLDSAKAESLEAIGAALKENGKVIVTGCMGAEPEQIRDRFPNVLAIVVVGGLLSSLVLSLFMLPMLYSLFAPPVTPALHDATDALTEGARALLYYTAGQVDRGTIGMEAAQQRADVLVPMLKAWGTEIGCEVASLGIQVHGGMGFIEETGAAQHLRDSRIAPIYEGTNGIQAADLVTRKLGYENGGVLQALMAEIASEMEDVPEVAALAKDAAAIGQWMSTTASLDDKLAGSVPFTTMCAVAVW